MHDFNPWIDAAIIASLWVPCVGYLVWATWHGAKKNRTLRGATRVIQ